MNFNIEACVNVHSGSFDSKRNYDEKERRLPISGESCHYPRMDKIWDFIAKHSAEELVLVTHAPVILMMTVLFAISATWVVATFHLSERMAALTERLSTKDAIILQKQSVVDDYKNRLDGATPLEVANELLALKSKVSDLQSKINRPQRRLTDTQIEKLTKLVGENWDTTAGYLISSTTDTESNRYAKQLIKVFRAAGSNVYHNPGSHDDGEHGVIVFTPDPPTDERFIKIFDFFDKAEIPYTKATDENAPDHHYIFVCPEEL